MNGNGGVSFRQIRIEEEIKQWAQLCSLAFSSKPNPPSIDYFLQHYYADPFASISLVFVAIETSSQEIIGSVRLFDRSLFVRRSEQSRTCPTRAFGIGMP